MIHFLRKTLSLLVSRRWWWVTLLVLVAMGVMVRLGVWQLDRLEQRRAANAVLRQQLEADPLLLNDVAPGEVDLTAMPDRRVSARGAFDFSQQILVRPKNYQGSAGGHLVAPLRLEGREEAVLVDRGWIPEAEMDPSNWSSFDEAGPLTVTGVIQRTETARNVQPPEEPQQEWFRIDVEAIERQLPYDVLPVYVLQTPEEGNQSLPYRLEPDIDLSQGPHLGYAIQWFAFTLMLGGGYIYFIHQQSEPSSSPNGHHSDSED
ncbi:MAG TPA: SURF1 family protein [Candidatus Sulfomarinibacteraceae bacterium]|nr:SURF1 family protein [Candidatus Sulfomarinibacteraceae bacterium]